MMIRRLDDSTIGRIAAGEVVERPASVVKELVENSLDAGASNITVSIERGGKRLISVVDDGMGISGEDLLLAPMRHTTSKIRGFGDLEGVETCGFRGEALASIAAAAELEIISRTAGGEGKRLFHDGTEFKVEPSPSPEGTRALVNNIFSRTPARLKFLKSDAAEAVWIMRAMTRAALGRPDVAFQFLNEGKTVLRTRGSGKLERAAAEVLGEETAGSMIEAEGKIRGIRVSALLGSPETARRTRSRQFVFLGSRPIDDRTVSHAIFSACESFVPRGYHPAVIVRLEVPHGMYDLNVHPAKSEVRFTDPRSVHRAVERTIRTRLAGTVMDFGPLAPAHGKTGEETGPGPDHIGGSAEPDEGKYAGGRERDLAAEPSPAYPACEKEDLLGRIPSFKGSIMGRYILAEDEGGLIIVDIHAAHERLLYERLLDPPGGKSLIQDLLIPEEFDVAPDEEVLLSRHIEDLAGLGLSLERREKGRWVLKSLPAELAGPAGGRPLVREVIDGLAEEAEDDSERSGRTPSAEGRPESAREIIARKACHAAVRSGRSISEREYASLIRDLATAADPNSCPHGRPTMIRMEGSEIDRMFGR